MPTELQTQALEALKQVPADESSRRSRAIKALRDMTDKRYQMRDYIDAVVWAEAHSQTAADLPDGSIVATKTVAYIKSHPSDWCQWRGTHGGHVTDAQIDEDMAAGAQVLRVGTGEVK